MRKLLNEPGFSPRPVFTTRSLHASLNRIGLPGYYEIEERTVEKNKVVMPGTAGLKKT